MITWLNLETVWPKLGTKWVWSVAVAAPCCRRDQQTQNVHITYSWDKICSLECRGNRKLLNQYGSYDVKDTLVLDCIILRCLVISWLTRWSASANFKPHWFSGKAKKLLHKLDLDLCKTRLPLNWLVCSVREFRRVCSRVEVTLHDDVSVLLLRGCGSSSIATGKFSCLRPKRRQ